MKGKKIWCLHCGVITIAGESDENGWYECSHCEAGDWDLEVAGSGFTKQAYPKMKYADYEVGKTYPLYP